MVARPQGIHVYLYGELVGKGVSQRAFCGPGYTLPEIRVVCLLCVA